jgi:hypothetical protein
VVLENRTGSSFKKTAVLIDQFSIGPLEIAKEDHLRALCLGRGLHRFLDVRAGGVGPVGIGFIYPTNLERTDMDVGTEHYHLDGRIGGEDEAVAGYAGFDRLRHNEHHSAQHRDNGGSQTIEQQCFLPLLILPGT